MNHSFRFDEPASIPTPMLRRVLPAMVQLWRRYACAQAAQRDAWEFALPGTSLTGMGLGPEEVRWLVRAEYVLLRPSRTCPRAATAQRLSAWSSLEEVEVVIGESGAALVESILNACELDVIPGKHDEKYASKPRWDAERRELWFDGVLVKRFRKPGPNQELILAAFERQGWRKRIDDPLPHDEDISPVDRLHDAAKRLTASLAVPLLKFGGDGKGTGVCWRSLAPPPQDEL